MQQQPQHDPPPNKHVVVHNPQLATDEVVCGICMQPVHDGLNCCYFCGKNDHSSVDCWSLKRALKKQAAQQAAAAAAAAAPPRQVDIRCTRCDYFNHTADQCPTPQEELFCRYCKAEGDHVIGNCQLMVLNQTRKARPCSSCGSDAHCFFACPNEQPPEELQQQRHCAYCRKFGHSIADCETRMANERKRRTPCVECGLDSHNYYDCNRVARRKDHQRQVERYDYKQHYFSNRPATTLFQAAAPPQGAPQGPPPPKLLCPTDFPALQ